MALSLVTLTVLWTRRAGLSVSAEFLVVLSHRNEPAMRSSTKAGIETSEAWRNDYDWLINGILQTDFWTTRLYPRLSTSCWWQRYAIRAQITHALPVCCCRLEVLYITGSASVWDQCRTCLQYYIARSGHLLFHLKSFADDNLPFVVNQILDHWLLRLTRGWLPPRGGYAVRSICLLVSSCCVIRISGKVWLQAAELHGERGARACNGGL